MFAVGKGPDGLGLYRLSDEDGDRHADKCETLLKFTGEAAEHGPHAVVLGPDGLLYLVWGIIRKSIRRRKPQARCTMSTKAI